MIHVAVISTGDSAGDNLASKMRLAAQDKGIEMEVTAVPVNNIDKIEKADILWVAPNARYEEDTVKKWCDEHKAKYDFIEPLAFSTMNGELMVDKTVELAK